MHDIFEGFSSTILSVDFLKEYATKQPPWGFSGLGYITYKRTYARKLSAGGTEEWWQTLARCINGAQKIGAKYTKEEAETLFDLMFNLKCSFGGRMLWQLGTSTVDRYGANSLLNCLSGETKVLTRQGWKKIKDLSGKIIEIVSKNGKWLKAPFKEYGYQKLLTVVFENKNKTKTTVIEATPDHRWFILDKHNGPFETTTKELSSGMMVPVVRGKNSSKQLSPQGIQHGLVFGDGTCNGYESTIDLIGDTLKYCQKYFRINSYLVINGKNYHRRYKNLPNYYKQMVNINENKQYLSGFLAGWIAADGSVNKSNGVLRLFNKSKNILEQAKDIAAVLGYRTGEPYLERNYNPFDKNDETSEMWSITFHRSDNPHHLLIRKDHLEKYGDISEHDYDNYMRVVEVVDNSKTELVYCSEVPKYHSFVINDNILTGNCWFSAIRKPEDFCFIFENLMLGGGVGFSVKREDVHELPKIKRGVNIIHKAVKDTDFIVPDSREGWINLLRNVLNCFFVTGKDFSYSTILVRGAGEPISGFGGVASGPMSLIEGIEIISKILKSREGKKLRSIDALDICNLIGSIVVSGNVRRSAEIAIGDPDDYYFLRAKRWDLGKIPNWRNLSNNTIAADSFDQISQSVWDGFNGNGEPYGLFNLPLAKKYGRLKEERKDVCEGMNPCGEVPLADKECCNLAELFLNNISSKEELLKAAILLYKTQKATAAMPFIHEETNDAVHKNMRLGLGCTGICQSFEKLEWLDDIYKELRKYDKYWSKENDWPESIRLTTTKPSGTLSLLAGSSPGVHPGYSQFFIRRIQLSSSDDLVNICKSLGYKIEYLRNFDGSNNYDTVVVSFPCEYASNTLLSKNMKAIEQLELVKKIQTIWSDNSVSCTVYYKKEELPDIKEWLKENYDSSIKSVSFLLHSDHGFEQAPYEEINETKYKELKSKVKNKLSDIFVNYSENVLEGIECSTGVCPIK